MFPNNSIRTALAVLSLGLGLTACAFNRSTASQPDSSPIEIAAHQTVSSQTIAEDQAMPKYDHLFILIEENKAYGQILGNPDAPNLNQLKQTYGFASDYYGVVHPSQANYIAMLGGSTFGIHDDDAFYCQPGQLNQFCPNSRQPGYVSHTIVGKSLMDQLEAKGLSWKGYFENLPEPGSKVVFAPNPVRALYAAKHNGFMAFKSVQDSPQRLKNLVGLEQLTIDLQNGTIPNYSHIVLNQCHDMHGLPECSNLQQLIKTGDAQVGKLVHQIMGSEVWSAPGNSAIVITWDEDDNPSLKTQPQGCCGFDSQSPANFGGGKIMTIVITNHGHKGVVDRTPYNHYCLLRTTEDAFGIHEYLNEAGNTAVGVKPMTPLFATVPR
jgi:hypothetical protein